jgi:hypothetical protein
MSVGHGGGMSSHPTWVKLIILEMIEERIKDAAVLAGIPAKKARVYDPFNTDYDFYIWVEADWDVYREIYHWYYSDELPDALEYMKDNEDEPNSSEAKTRIEYKKENSVAKRYGTEENPYKKYYDEAVGVLSKMDKHLQVFNASKSDSTIFYDIKQMKRMLELGDPKPDTKRAKKVKKLKEKSKGWIKKKKEKNN